MSNTETGGQVGASVIRVNGKRFASGLVWRSISNVSNIKKEVKAYNASDQMNINTMNDGAIIQAGFSKIAPSREKEFDGAWTLAGVLTHEIKEGSWIGVFSVEDTDEYALVAVRDGQIIPSCDVVGGFDDIQEILSEVLTLTQWESVYCDVSELSDSFGSFPLKRLGLNDLLTAKRWPRALRVRYINKKYTRLYLALGGVIALGVGGYLLGGGYLQERLQRELEMRQNEQIQSERERKEKQLARAQKVVESMRLEPHWYEEPKADAVLSACQLRAKYTPLNIAGWELIEFKCSKAKAEAIYERIAPMTVNDFEAMSEDMKVTGFISSYRAGLDRGSITFPLPEFYERGEENDLHRAAKWQKNWVNHFQRTEAPAKLEVRPHPEPPEPEGWVVSTLGGRDKAKPPAPWWMTFNWEVAGELDPFELLYPMLSKGMVIDSMNAKIKGDKWTWLSKGELHVK